MSLPPLNVKIGADTSGLDKGLNKSQQIAKRFAVGVAGAAVAVGTAMLAMTKRSMENLDALTKQARQIGLTADRFQAMSLVAAEAGVSTGALTNSLGIMQRNIVELQRGTQTQVRAFEALGLSIRDLEGLEADEQFERIAERLNAIEDPAVQTATAMEVFGRSGREVINMLDGYGDKLENATEFQRRFGIAISQTDAEQIERANDAVGRLGEAFGGIGNLLAVTVAPAVERFSNGLLGVAGAIADRLNPPTDDLLELLKETPGLMDAVALAGPGLEGSFGGVGSAARDAADDVGLLAGALQSFYDRLEEGSQMGGLAADITGGMGSFGGVTGGGTGDGELTGETEDFITNLPPIEFPSGGVEVNQADSNTVRPRQPPALVDEPVAIPSIGGGQAVRDQFEQRLEALQEGLATEAEIVQEWYENSMSVLNEGFERKLMTEEEYLEARARLEEEYARRSSQIEQMRQQSNLQIAAQGFGQILAAAGQGNDKLLKASKVFNAGMAWIDTLAGAARELRKGTFGFASAAAVIAKGIGFVNAINSVSSSGGGRTSAASAAGGGSAGGSAQQAQAPTTTFQFTLQNDPMGFGEQFARQMIEQLNEAQRNGGNVRGVLG
ncbi:hypothetical protein [Yoonia sp.]|uniref:hypothetical protein n=1 Tax=Yoonia sp. TaxID=2212373 RepID=UPI002E02F1CD|nr:hypothetical protein [Yoonia sp.]